MEVNGYSFHRRALTAFYELAAEEQAAVLQKWAALIETPASQWTPEQARRIPGDRSLYLARVNASLRIIVRAAEGHKPEVLDLVRNETLESFAQTAVSTEH